jgi:hypothetical protein
MHVYKKKATPYKGVAIQTSNITYTMEETISLSTLLHRRTQQLNVLRYLQDGTEHHPRIVRTHVPA